MKGALDIGDAADATRETPLLLSPLSIRGVTLRNRVMISPMCQYRSVEGGPTDWHLVHLGQFGIGGAGLVFGDETAVEERGRKTHDCAGLYNEAHVDQYRRITDFLKSVGAIPGIQLGHSGRKASSHGAICHWAPLRQEDAAKGRAPWTGVAPSPIALNADAHVPHQLTVGEIKTMLETWRIAALRAVDAGFDICEIHGAHGYLIHQFLSPLTNRRGDGYGGGRAGRMRFAFEIAEAVRSVWPADKPLFFRISCVDGKGGVWNMEDTIPLAEGLRLRGIDVIDCSSGGIQGGSAFPLIPRVPGYHVSYAARVRREVEIPTVAVGLITSPYHAEAILRNGDVDIIALGRGAMENPAWAAHAAAVLQAPDPYRFFPPDYAYRFRGRDTSRSAYRPEKPAAIPHAIGDERPYKWPEIRPDYSGSK